MSYSSFKRVFLRIPIYSLNSLKDILKDTDTYEAKIKSSSELMEAIKRSSDSFYQKLVNQNFTNSIKSTTYNYLSRVATRSSPYDLFSGIASGSLEDKSISQFKQKYSIISRVNLDYLWNS